MEWALIAMAGILAGCFLATLRCLLRTRIKTTEIEKETWEAQLDFLTEILRLRGIERKSKVEAQAALNKAEVERITKTVALMASQPSAQGNETVGSGFPDATTSEDGLLLGDQRGR